MNIKANIKNIIISFSFLLALLTVMIASIIMPDIENSYSERRELEQAPALTWQNIVSGNAEGERYFDLLEDYLLDQFPLRDTFRMLNSVTRRYVFMQKDVNDVYVLGSKIFKMDPVLNENAVENSANVYLKVIEKYFSKNGANIYYTIVPDKNYYSAAQNGYLALDYEKLFAIMDEKLSGNTKIDILDILSEDDYYRTDLHWDQTKILDVAEKLLESMTGKDITMSLDDYTKKEYEDFKGAYYGQAALPIKTDTLICLTNKELDACKVFNYESGRYVPMYDEAKLSNADKYNIYLQGMVGGLRIENPNCTNGKELVVFRDSFGSSLVPLLVSEYSVIKVIDLRYFNSAYIGSVGFADNCDVLFMYNTSSLNTYGLIK